MELDGDRKTVGNIRTAGSTEGGPTTEEGEREIATTVTESPKPPPNAPTYSRGPISNSQSLLGGEDAKEKDPGGDSQGKDSKGGTEGRHSKGETKGEDSKGVTKE